MTSKEHPAAAIMDITATMDIMGKKTRNNAI